MVNGGECLMNGCSNGESCSHGGVYGECWIMYGKW